MAMFPLWLMGTAAWTLPVRVNIRKSLASLLWFGSLALLGGLVLLQLVRISGAHPAPEIEPASWRTSGSWRSYLVDYGIEFLIALNFLSFNASAKYWTKVARIIKTPMRWLAGASFTLYLLHVPVAQFLAAISPWPVGTLPQRLFVLGRTFGVVLFVAEYTERRKTAWRKAISGILA